MTELLLKHKNCEMWAQEIHKSYYENDTVIEKWIRLLLNGDEKGWTCPGLSFLHTPNTIKPVARINFGSVFFDQPGILWNFMYLYIAI